MKMPAKIKTREDGREFLLSGIGQRKHNAPEYARADVMHGGYGRYVGTFDTNGTLCEFVYDKRDGTTYHIRNGKVDSEPLSEAAALNLLYRCRKCLNKTYGLGCYVS